MSVHFEVDTFDYLLKPTGQITAKAVIGNAQAGGWRMTLDGKELAKGTKPTAVAVGSAQSVKGKTLQVIITSVDVNQNTNEMVTTVTMGGGTGPNKFQQTFDDGGDGDTTVFTYLVDLT